MKETELIFAGRHIGYIERARSRRYGKPGSGENTDDGAHGRMNVAKYVDNSRLLKYPAPVGTWGIEPYIEGLPAKVRERVMEDRVIVREVYGAADGDGNHMRSKPFVALDHLHPARRRWSGSGPIRRL